MIRRPRGRPPATIPQPISDHAQPSVSVVIPCFNYAQYLPIATASALSQTGVVVDVVIVDDCSLDDSLAVARRLAIDDPRVHVLANATNRGPVATFNAGLTHATGDFLVRLDADDALTPGSLARACALALHHPSVGLVYGRPVHFADQMPAAHRDVVRSWTIWQGPDWLRACCATGTNVITSPEVLMRRSTVELVGGQRELPHTHDMEMWFRLSAVADVGYLDGPDQAFHRDHPSSLSMTADDPFGLILLRERRDAFDLLFDGSRFHLRDGAELHETARRSLGTEALRRAIQHIDRGRSQDPRVRELVDFAIETAPSTTQTREWRQLRRRQEHPAWFGKFHPWSVASATARRAKAEYRHLHWRHWGVESDREVD